MTTGPACASSDPNLFFPKKGEPSEPGLRVCLFICMPHNGPDFVRNCFYSAPRGEEGEHGIFGGTSPRQRRDVYTGKKTIEELWEYNLNRRSMRPPGVGTRM